MEESEQFVKSIQRIIGNASMLTLLLCGVLIFIINGKVKSSKWRYHASLSRVLWKIVSKQCVEEKYFEYCWSWRKLVLCGVMLSCLIMISFVRMVHYKMVLLMGFFSLLLFGLITVVVWYKYFVPLLSTAVEENDRDEVINSDAKSRTATAQNDTSNSTKLEGWSSKIRIKREGQEAEDLRLPVTIVTGYLGSGKTTLVKRILNNTIQMKILVIENEIGAEGIDHDLLLQQSGKEEIVLMNNGCICCTVRKDLLTVFHKLFQDESFACLNWIVIETTGIADPSPLIQSLYMDEQCRQRMRLDAVITVVDSKHIPLHIKDYHSNYRDSSSHSNSKSTTNTTGAHDKISEAILQISYADRILLNKCDLVTTAELESINEAVAALNPSAQIIACEHSNVPLTDILNIRAFDATTNKALIDSSNKLSSSQSSFMQVDSDGKILKKKININSRRNVSDSSTNEVTTVSLTADRPLDLNALNEFLSMLLRENGNSLYRLKGILSVLGFEQQLFVAHGVHMVFEGEVIKATNMGNGSSTSSNSSGNKSRLVLIGKGLNEKQLTDSFNKCIDSSSA